jgi:hypothetical protein
MVTSRTATKFSGNYRKIKCTLMISCKFLKEPVDEMHYSSDSDLGFLDQTSAIGKCTTVRSTNDRSITFKATQK